jgi:hypothetical protein
MEVKGRGLESMRRNDTDQATHQQINGRPKHNDPKILGVSSSLFCFLSLIEANPSADRDWMITTMTMITKKITTML